MKQLNKRINKRKPSKITLKTHHQHDRPESIHAENKDIAESTSAIRPEDVHLHQHY